MKCTACDRQLYLYREGELSAGERRRLEKHLRRCPECAARAEEIVRAGAVAADLAAADRSMTPPDDLVAEIMQNLPGSGEKASPAFIPVRRGRIALVPALAATALILLTLVTTHELVLVHRLGRLESAIATWTQAVRSGAQEYARLAATLERIEPIVRAAGLLPSPRFPAPVLTDDEVNAWLTGRGLTRGEAGTLLGRVRAEVPGLAGIDIADGLSEHELEILFRNRDRIATVLRSL